MFSLGSVFSYALLTFMEGVRSLFHQPFFQSTHFRIKPHPYHENPSLICLIGQGIALVLYLCQGFGSGLVYLEFEDVDKIIRFQYAVSSSPAAVDFTFDELAQQGEDDVEHRLEVMLERRIIGGVGDTRKEGGEDVAGSFCIACFQAIIQGEDVRSRIGDGSLSKMLSKAVSC